MAFTLLRISDKDSEAHEKPSHSLEKKMALPAEQSLEFEKLKGRCIKVLNKNKYISVATAAGDDVRVRVVDYANQDLSIGFYTWEHTVKVEHLKKNPKISLCIDNLQIEGTAAFAGHPRLAPNSAFGEIFKERNPNPYKNFIQTEDAVLIMVVPVLMVLMTYESRHLYSDYLDLRRGIAFRKVLSPWDAEL